MYTMLSTPKAAEQENDLWALQQNVTLDASCRVQLIGVRVVSWGWCQTDISVVVKSDTVAGGLERIPMLSTVPSFQTEDEQPNYRESIMKIAPSVMTANLLRRIMSNDKITYEIKLRSGDVLQKNTLCKVSQRDGFYDAGLLIKGTFLIRFYFFSFLHLAEALTRLGEQFLGVFHKVSNVVGWKCCNVEICYHHDSPWSTKQFEQLK